MVAPRVSPSIKVAQLSTAVAIASPRKNGPPTTETRIACLLPVEANGTMLSPVNSPYLTATSTSAALVGPSPQFASTTTATSAGFDNVACCRMLRVGGSASATPEGPSASAAS